LRDLSIGGLSQNGPLMRFAAARDILAIYFLYPSNSLEEMKHEHNL